jgi:hypothetical protein
MSGRTQSEQTCLEIDRHADSLIAQDHQQTRGAQAAHTELPQGRHYFRPCWRLTLSRSASWQRKELVSKQGETQTSPGVGGAGCADGERHVMTSASCIGVGAICLDRRGTSAGSMGTARGMTRYPADESMLQKTKKSGEYT